MRSKYVGFTHNSQLELLYKYRVVAPPTAAFGQLRESPQVAVLGPKGAAFGAEVTATDRFRYELYLARQVDRLPDQKKLDALGVVLKWYF